MTDQFQWWRDALAGNRGPIHEGEPQSGYYRGKRKDKATGAVTFQAVAYWRDTQTGALRCHLNGRDLDEQRALELWPFVADRPVPEDWYFGVLDGKPWPDVNEAVAGHNQAPPDDSAEAIQERIEDLAREAARLVEDAEKAPLTKEACDHASDLANTFGELEAKTKSLHQIAKAPHLEAGRAVDGKWFPLRDRAAQLKAMLKAKVVTPFLKKLAEERQKAASAAIAAGAAPEELPPTRVVAGSSKRSTGLRTFTSARVTDWDALLAHLKEHPDIRAEAQRIADAAAKAGVPLPGTEIVKEQKAA